MFIPDEVALALLKCEIDPDDAEETLDDYGMDLDDLEEY